MTKANTTLLAVFLIFLIASPIHSQNALDSFAQHYKLKNWAKDGAPFLELMARNRDAKV